MKANPDYVKSAMCTMCLATIVWQFLHFTLSGFEFLVGLCIALSWYYVRVLKLDEVIARNSFLNENADIWAFGLSGPAIVLTEQSFRCTGMELGAQTCKAPEGFAVLTQCSLVRASQNRWDAGCQCALHYFRTGPVTSGADIARAQKVLHGWDAQILLFQ